MINRGQFLKDLCTEFVADYINIRKNKLEEFLYIYKKNGPSWNKLMKTKKMNLQPIIEKMFSVSTRKETKIYII